MANKSNLPAKPEDVRGGFNLPVANLKDSLDPETLKEIQGESNEGFEVEGASCPYVSIRQKAVEGSDGRTILYPAGGFHYANTPLEVPDADGEVGLEVSVFGDRAGRTYFKPESKDKKPMCRSMDGIYGQGDPGGKCSLCPLGQWINNTPPICKPHKHLFCYDHTIKNGPPLYIFKVGRSSLRRWTDFKALSSVQAGSIPLQFLIIRITTEFVEAKPQSYFLCKFELKCDDDGKPVVVGAELAKAIKQVRDSNRESLERVVVIEDDEATSFDPNKLGGEALDPSKDVSKINDKFPEGELPY